MVLWYAVLTLTGHNSADVDLLEIYSVVMTKSMVVPNHVFQLLLKQMSLRVVLGQQFDLQKVDLELSFQELKNLNLNRQTRLSVERT